MNTAKETKPAGKIQRQWLFYCMERYQSSRRSSSVAADQTRFAKNAASPTGQAGQRLDYVSRDACSSSDAPNTSPVVASTT